MISADVRLDNRAELAARLDIPAALLPHLGDSQLILAAYLRWGEACLAALLGDFAFILWDGPRRRLFAARDPLGIKPLFVHVTPTLALLGGDIRAVLGNPDAPRTPDPVMLARMARSVQDVAGDATFVSGVSKLPPAHSLTIDAQMTRLLRYWDPDAFTPQRTVRMDEAAAEVRALLEAATRARLRLPALPDALYWRLPGMGPEPVSHPCHGPVLRQHLVQLPPLRHRPQAGVRATQRMLLAYGHLHQRMEGWAAAGADAGLVYRYPLLDRRMVELALRLPAAAYVHPGHARYLYRRAIEDLLPAEIVWGNLKYEPARVRELLRVNHAALPAVLDALLPAPTDWVDGACLRSQAATLQPDDLPGIGKTSHLVQILAAGRQLARLPSR